MIHDDPLIDTCIGKVRASEARGHFVAELKRTPTADKPRNSSLLLDMLRAFPDRLKKYSALEVIEDFRSYPHFFDSDTAKDLIRDSRMIAYAPHGEAAGEYICFGDLSRNEMGQQCQYGSRFVHGMIDGYPNLAEGLRVEGDPFDYHFLRMHVDDIPTFMQRYYDHREARMHT